MIQITDVSKYYGTQCALDHVSFSVQKGETVGLLGPNGAGKSTLMKIITCYLPPSEGDVVVSGHSIYDDNLAVRRAIGYLPEHNPLYLDMYVREFLRFAADIYHMGHAARRADDIIDRVGLTPEADKKIGQLSKGYRQRVGIAQALIHDPQVLILDEPTTGLDPNQIEEIHRLIRDVGRDKVILLSTHIMQEVEAMCSRAIIIHSGRIVSDSPLNHVTSQQLTAQFHALTRP